MMILGQHFIGGFDGIKITPAIKTLIQKYHIGGFVLFKRNIESIKQVSRLIEKLQSLSSTPLFIAVDQEGGRVFRLGPPFTVLPPMATVGHYFRHTKNKKTLIDLGRFLAKELKAVGFNWDFAPVVDVNSNPRNPIIGNRSFGPDPQLVTRCAGLILEGLHREKMISCAKHFPGHGATSHDSHHELPVVPSPSRLLWKRDMDPFRRLINQKKILTIMTAHVIYPDFDEKNCATLSSEILSTILRRKLHFKGLIVSDDLLMKAISDHRDLTEASHLFFQAGGDVALICRHPEQQIQVMEALKKKFSQNKVFHTNLQKSAARILKLKKMFCRRSKTADLKIIGCPAHQKIIEQLKGY